MLELATGMEKVNLKKNDINDYYLSGFKFSSLTLETVDNGEKETYNDDDVNGYWSTILDEEAKLMRINQENQLGKGKRVKKPITAMNNNDGKGGGI